MDAFRKLRREIGFMNRTQGGVGAAGGKPMATRFMPSVSIHQFVCFTGRSAGK